MTVLATIILLGVLIFVHELGHFLVARKLGMVAEVFSIGFGPATWKKTHKGVVYKIGIIPFGGYVALPQMDPGGMAESAEGGAPLPSIARRGYSPVSNA